MTYFFILFSLNFIYIFELNGTTFNKKEKELVKD